MSLWHCPTHGLTGPMACCGDASLARLGAALPVTSRTAPDDFAPHPQYGPCDSHCYGRCSACRNLLYTLMQECADPAPPDSRKFT